MTTEVRDELKIGPPRPGHLFQLSRKLRQIDRKELAAVSDKDPYSDLLYSASVSNPCWVLTKNEQPIAIGGVAPHFDDAELGVPWFLATDDIDDSHVSYWLAAHSRELVDKIQGKFQRLENYVSAENGRTIAWLKWLGFEIGEPAELGRNGERLCRIYKERPACACL